MEKIKHAAILRITGDITVGRDHGQCLHRSPPDTCEEMGFMTSENRFVDREEAAKIAIKAGQIDRDTDLLFSEDMWEKHEMYNGKHEYSLERGYYIDGE